MKRRERGAARRGRRRGVLARGGTGPRSPAGETGVLASARQPRARANRSRRRARTEARRPRLAGLDFARQRAAAAPRVALATLLAALLLAALGLSALRLEILELRYALAAAGAEEDALLQARRALTLDVERLRDPLRLRELAQSRGFALPERVIVLERAGAPAAGGALPVRHARVESAIARPDPPGSAVPRP